jgi:hypothetical protein
MTIKTKTTVTLTGEEIDKAIAEYATAAKPELAGFDILAGNIVTDMQFVFVPKPVEPSTPVTE